MVAISTFLPLSIERLANWGRPSRGVQRWYNDQHKHSALNFITPAQRHRGADTAVLAQRKAVYQAAKARHPERWSGLIRKWDLTQGVWLNPPKSAPPEKISTRTAA